MMEREQKEKQISYQSQTGYENQWSGQNNYQTQWNGQSEYQNQWNGQSNAGQVYTQGVCPTCGTPLLNGMCPKCASVSTIQQQNKKDKPFKQYFMNPNEKLVTTLGNNYIQNYIANGSISRGFAIVSNRRAYFQGKSYKIVYDRRGNMKVNQTDQSRVVDLQDITGTGYDSAKTLSHLLRGWICLACALLAFLFTNTLGSFETKYEYSSGSHAAYTSNSTGNFWGSVTVWLLVGMLVAALVFFFLYYKSKITLFTIQYAGGEIAFNINWFPQAEMDDFQRQLRLAKDDFKDQMMNRRMM